MEYPRHLDEWREVYPGGLATFNAWLLGSGKFMYKCTIKGDIDMTEYSDVALNFGQIQKLFEAREDFKKYL